VTCPSIRHLTYDIIPGEAAVIDAPDIVILEGLNVLQAAPPAPPGGSASVSDFFDFSIYVDAPKSIPADGTSNGFLLLRATAFKEPASYFHRYAACPTRPRSEWPGNLGHDHGPNLRENILPTRERAHLILVKGPDHAVETIRLRKL